MVLKTFFALLLLACFSGVWSTQENYRLLQQLMMSYDKDVLPVCNQSDLLTVKIGLAVVQVVSIDEPNQLLTSNVWLRWRWTDCQLKWNASEYNGLKEITISSNKIWFPDITLYDNAQDGLGSIKAYSPKVYSDGSVAFNSPAILKTMCKINVHLFPFDRQRCRMKWGSWTYHGYQIDVTNRSSSGDVDNYISNGEWDLIEVPVSRNVLLYGCCPEPYPDVTFHVVIQRRSLYYMYNLIFPCILLTGIALLNFILPPDSGEKVSLGITVLLSLTVFLLLVSESIPPTSDTVPLIGKYFGATIALITISCAMTVCILNFHHKGEAGRPVPKWIRKLVLKYLAKVLCMTDHYRSKNIVKVAPVSEVKAFQFMANENVNHNGLKNSPSQVRGNLDNGVTAKSPQPYQEQLHSLKKMEHHFEGEDEDQETIREWKRVAAVIDRLLLIIFSIVSILVTVIILTDRTDMSAE